MATSPLRKVLLVIALVAGVALAIVGGNYMGHELAHRRETAEMADRVAKMNRGEALTGLNAGDPFPGVELVGTAGVTDSRALVAGHETLVFFMSTECEPCAEAVRRWSGAEVPSGVSVFGVIDQPPGARDAYVAENGVSFPVYSDSADLFGREYDVEVYPTIVAVDANGTMVFVRHGVDAGFTPSVALEVLRAGIDEGR